MFVKTNKPIRFDSFAFELTEIVAAKSGSFGYTSIIFPKVYFWILFILDNLEWFIHKLAELVHLFLLIFGKIIIDLFLLNIW